MQTVPFPRASGCLYIRLYNLTYTTASVARYEYVTTEVAPQCKPRGSQRLKDARDVQFSLVTKLILRSLFCANSHFVTAKSFFF